MLIPLEHLIEKHSLLINGIIHIGAHLAEEATAYQRCGISQVFWIEANPALIPELRKAADAYGHSVIEALISNSDGQLREFFVTNNTQSSSLLTLEKHKDYYPQITVSNKLSMLTRTLDSLVKECQIQSCNFLNLDIQGAELLALQGAINLLSDIDYIYTEVNAAELYTGCAQLPAIDDFLRDFHRVELEMTFAEWGDAFYIRT